MKKPACKRGHWTDHKGRRWLIPGVKDRLRCGRIRGHRALREYVIWRDENCQSCGSAEDLIADHIKSKRNGGTHHPGNLQALCKRCNTVKSNTIDRGRVARGA